MTTRVCLNVMVDGRIDLDVAIGSEDDAETRRLVEAVTAGVLSALEGARAVPRRQIGPTETKRSPTFERIASGFDSTGMEIGHGSPGGHPVDERIDHG